MKRPILLGLLYSSAILLLSGCAATQQVNQFSETKPKTVCIAKHEAVREGVLSALQQGLTKHDVNFQVMNAQYVEKNKMWIPSINPNDAKDCDAVMFYVANWSWDLAMYMHFANIWVTDPGMTRKLAQAKYQAGAGASKFINAETKILEMVDSMFVEYYSKHSMQITKSVRIEPKVAQPSPDEQSSPVASTPESPGSGNPVATSNID